MVGDLASWLLYSLLKTVSYNANSVTSSPLILKNHYCLIQKQCGEFNRRFQELQQHGWDISANGKHADPVFRELLLFPSPAFTSVIAPELAKFSNLPLYMRHTYNIDEHFSMATKVFINLPVAPTFTILHSTRLPTYPPLLPLLHPFNTISPHLLIPIQTSNLPRQRGQTNLDQKAATLYGAIQSHVINNGKTIQFCKIHKWNPSHGNDKCTSKINKIILKITSIQTTVIATSPSQTWIPLKHGKSSNPYPPTTPLLPTNEWQPCQRQKRKLNATNKPRYLHPNLLHHFQYLSLPLTRFSNGSSPLLPLQFFNPSPCQQFEIIIDSGASTSYTNNLSAFVSNVESLPGIPINGIANQLTATAIGTVNRLVNDDDGIPATIALRAMYAPGLAIRLYLHQTSPSNSDSFSTRSHTITLRWHLHTKTIHHNQHNNLPILRAQNHTAYIEQQALYCAFTSSNITLSKAKQQVLNEHYRLCHLPMDIIQRITPTSKHFSAEAKSCEIPLCSSCIFGKQHRTPFLRTKSREITKSHMKPGDLVSVNYFESTLAGRFLLFKFARSHPMLHFISRQRLPHYVRSYANQHQRPPNTRW